VSNIGAGFDLIKNHQNGLLIDGSPFSVRCILEDTAGNKQGEGATLPEDNENYDAADELRGLPDQIGLALDAEGLPIMADSAEFFLNMNSVTLGVVKENWKLTFWNYEGSKEYRISSVARDKTLGVYRLELQLRKAAKKGAKISRTLGD